MNYLLMPLVVAQGLRVRRTTEVLSPAAGPTTGQIAGTGRPLEVAVVGESTAAGCGVDRHDDGFVGALAREVAERTGQPVNWQVVGQYGATARRIRYRLLPQLRLEMDLTVVLAGVNDVLTRRQPSDWGGDLTAIIEELNFRTRHVLVPGLPSFAEFPSLPRTLARYLAQRAQVLDEVSQQVCGRYPRAAWVRSTGVFRMEPSFFARDGFHPSAECYRLWARTVADTVDFDRLARPQV